MTPHPVVRIAELEIDPAQLDAYRAALKKEIAASISVEPGVLTLLAVSVKDQPNQIRIFETYADRAAYEAHLQTFSFQEIQERDTGDGEIPHAHQRLTLFCLLQKATEP